ncbi:hypothetical protein R3P38DRAFT_2812216 [Favolaschia claudopus]|uniref:Uncharacterized protein n=1 Tax=Favolaschia claudopus TaxID=2862362 RepID=A0AAV9Z7E1_9AGAR
MSFEAKNLHIAQSSHSEVPKEYGQLHAIFRPTVTGVPIQTKKGAAAVRSIVGQERDALLFKNIVTSSLGVSIGPLEYCGVGHIEHIGGIARGSYDSQYHEERSMQGLDRISKHLDAVGQRKRGRSDKENKALGKRLTALDAGYSRVGKVEEGEGDDLSLCAPKPKRRRLSADQKLALLASN